MSNIVDKFNNGKVHFRDGAVGWLMNDGEFRPLMNDLLKDLYEAGLISEECVRKTNDVRYLHTAKIIKEYAESHPRITDEERAEARAAHGPGVAMVNMLTGQKWTT